ncbi:putative HD superfamily hydrolase [Frankia torreyi]|uniref:5'-deoxynucleotidase n=1 Tax=Frankia torreyi TaxID=1856 RepID=A0A0D8B5U9_9ACTN|nr:MULTISPECIES: HD domain-containing protein [Frankia]KJE19566.1 putative HD superfamily hydrolase [Frankia torreyi]KQM02004.1 putative HD superfamily hydrolase [Frankia sp. CpI1-P]
MDSSSRDIDFLYEIGTMRHIVRTWMQFGGLNVANVAEHTLRVAWISSVIAKREGADVGRCALLALAHDLCETRTGDVNYLTRMYVDRNEMLAIKDISQGTSLADDLLDLWAEYEEQKTLESRIVKDADSLDCDLELSELSSTGADMSQALCKTRERAAEKLRTESGRALYAVIAASHPHAWHLGTRNRLTSGDWHEGRR